MWNENPCGDEFPTNAVPLEYSTWLNGFSGSMCYFAGPIYFAKKNGG